jgi:hypothetical protein
MPPSTEDQTYIQALVLKKNRDRLQVLAKERRTSLGALIRQALQEKLEREGVQIDLEEGLAEWGRKSSKNQSSE